MDERLREKVKEMASEFGDNMPFSGNLNDGNKLISEFMGHAAPILHKDWNQLMEIVEKIESIRWIPTGGDDENWFIVNITGDQCSIDRETHNSSGIIVDSYMGNKSKIERVYEVIIAFIQWYNKEK